MDEKTSNLEVLQKRISELERGVSQDAIILVCILKLGFDYYLRGKLLSNLQFAIFSTHYFWDLKYQKLGNNKVIS